MAPRPSGLPAYRRPPPRRGGRGSFGPKIPPAPTRGEPSRTLAFASGDLRAAIGQNPDYRKALVGAEIVTLSIGGNDLFQAEQVWLSGACEDGACYDEALADFRRDWQAILTKVVELRKPGEAMLRVTNTYNPLITADQAVQCAPALSAPIQGEPWQRMQHRGLIAMRCFWS